MTGVATDVNVQAGQFAIAGLLDITPSDQQRKGEGQDERELG